ncbi:hypothetical protein SB860_39650, partial [Burkholderia sp. SIMBA_019]
MRTDLAAAYRLAALERWDDLIYTHISATVPGEPDHFLINPRCSGRRLPRAIPGGRPRRPGRGRRRFPSTGRTGR